jgi:deazaflavin-dependent oxidoreductase (nitroreductase family)
MRKAWLTLIKHTLNRATARAARSGGGPFSLVQTVGRVSGKPYETPIIVQPVEGGLVIELTYGPAVNWYKNVVAANGCTVLRHRVRYTVEGLEPMTTAEGLESFPIPQRWVLTALHRRHFVKFLVVATETVPGAPDRGPDSGQGSRVAVRVLLSALVISAIVLLRRRARRIRHPHI